MFPVFALRVTLLVLWLMQVVVGELDSCVAKAPRNLGMADREALCSIHPSSEGPANCAKDARGNLPKELKLQLCQTATDEWPALCFNKAPSNMAAEHRVGLCKDSSSMGPTECAEALRMGSSIEGQLKVQLCATASPAYADGPAKCFKAAPKSLGTHLRVALCAGATSAAPSECVNKLKGSAQKFAPEERVKLCTGATSIAPAECYHFADKKAKSMTVEERVEVCQGAETVAPGECAAKVKGYDIQGHHKVVLCKGATNSGPGDCMQGLRGSLTIGEKVSLCNGAVDSSPALCFDKVQAASNRGLTTADKSWLCRGAKSVSPAECVNEMPYTAAANESLAVCERATTTGPAKCFAKLTGGSASLEAREIPSDLVASLCQDAPSDMPAKCILALPSSSLRLSIGPDLCRGTESTFPATCAKKVSLSHRFDAGPEASERRVLALCKDAESDGRATCAISAPPYLSQDERVSLCVDAESDMPAQCVLAAPTHFTSKQQVQLCRGSLTLHPALCAMESPVSLTSQKQVDLCAEAISSTPAHCAQALTSTLTEGELRKCRNAESYPASLMLGKITRQVGELSGKLEADLQFQVMVHLLDQFGMPRVDDNATVVFAKLEEKGSHGHQLKGTRWLTAVNGVVYFEELALSAAGIYRVFFTAREYTIEGEAVPERGKGITGTSLVVHVSDKEYVEDPCETVFQNFQSSATYHHGGFSRHHQTEHCSETQSCSGDGDLPRGEEAMDSGGPLGSWEDEEDSKIVYIPRQFIFPLLSCSAALEESGAEIMKGWNGEIWVALHPEGHQVMTGVGLPSDIHSLNLWDRLGVPEEASKSDIRKAYHRLSLKWHPDRWVRFPEGYRDVAHNVFLAINDAYRELMTLQRRTNGSL
jgi:hypothetical protein